MRRLPVLPACLFATLAACTGVQALAQTPLSVARYSDSGELSFPPDTDLWVYMGSTLGGDYNDVPFDPAAPATFDSLTVIAGIENLFDAAPPMGGGNPLADPRQDPVHVSAGIYDPIGRRFYVSAKMTF